MVSDRGSNYSLNINENIKEKDFINNQKHKKIG